jgi:tellurite resistance protein
MPNRDDWTDLHHLAYVYAAVASSDGSVTNEELEVLCYKLHQWFDDIDVNELVQIVLTAVAALGQDMERDDRKPLRASIGLLAEALDDDGRAAALGDLLSIAAADGTLVPDEGDVLVMIQKAWEPAGK